MNPRNAGRRRLPALLRLFLPIALLAATCVNTKGPRQGWDEQWGELVSHKNFPGDCALCHVPDRWDVLKTDFSFDHEKQTGVALKGAHKEAACLRCHNDFGPVSAYTERGCGGCHLDPHQTTLGGDCESCHNEMDWRPRGLIADHSARGFPLIGAHAVTACEKCHVRAPVGEFRGAPRHCDTCHRDDALAAKSFDHAAMGWLASCERCHIPTTFGGAGFVHGFFPLSGGHSGIACADCHGAGAPGPIPSNCNSCHSDDFQTAPNHVSLGFPIDCEKCHSTASWKGASFDHSFFPLSGGHNGLDCGACHTSGTPGPISRDCNSCHSDDFQGAPNHVTLGFSRSCEKCHTTQQWEGATFSHTSFPLTGGHSGVTCAACHGSGTPGPIASSCNSCHSDDFQGAPNHATLGYPRGCEQCHTTQQWKGAKFTHRFPLQGAHNVTCTVCHDAGSTTAFNCLSCHAHSQQSMSSKHREVGNYQYNSASCYRCHANGQGDD